MQDHRKKNVELSPSSPNFGQNDTQKIVISGKNIDLYKKFSLQRLIGIKFLTIWYTR